MRRYGTCVAKCGAANRLLFQEKLALQCVHFGSKHEDIRLFSDSLIQDVAGTDLHFDSPINLLNFKFRSFDDLAFFR